MVIIELNEFSPDLLEEATRQLGLTSIARLLALPRSNTTSPDTRERDGLDPWVQWVSMHTGVPSSVHGIAHLAEASKLTLPQIWEVLDSKGVSSGIWGPMNARRGATRNCCFFFPDPWTWTERAYPEPLNELLSLPRYYSQNYLNLSAPPLALSLLRALRFSLRPIAFSGMLGLLPTIACTFARHGVKPHILFSLFDLVSAELFIRYCARYAPEFKILFLNSIAHLQHNHWADKENLSDEMKPCFVLLDRILERLFTAFPSPEPFLVANGFSQVHAASRPQYLYRQTDPERFLTRSGIMFDRIEQLMTNDGHVYFASEHHAITAEQALRDARLDGSVPLFDVRRSADTPLELFFQLDYWEDIPRGSVLEVNGHRLPFYGLFERVTRKTGDHVPEGCILSRDMNLDGNIANHELFHLVASHYEYA